VTGAGSPWSEHPRAGVNVLGIDTSTDASTACVLREDGEHFEIATGPGSRAHARELMPAVTGVMQRSGLDWDDLQAIAVGIGPGAYTGLRIGIATSRALAQATGLELRPVSSLAALAKGIPDELALPLIDARRGELFAALYERGEERWPALAAAPEAVAERVNTEGISPLAAGNGSVRFRGVLEAAGIRVEADGSRAHEVRALHVCELAAGVSPVPPEAVLPDYLRLPDAKPRSQ
jgi:tRNA threonylcarbamoyladenosine biosynthesis protein TsaB